MYTVSPSDSFYFLKRSLVDSISLFVLNTTTVCHSDYRKTTIELCSFIKYSHGFVIRNICLLPSEKQNANILYL